MNIKNLLKEWRFLLLFFSLAISIYLLIPLEGTGVIVKSVSPNSPFYGKLNPGESLSWMNEIEIKNQDDIDKFQNFTGNLRFIHNGKLDIVFIEKPGLGITVFQRQPFNLNFGIDLIGGTRALIEPTENVSDIVIQQIIAAFETRINTYGLKEAKFQQINDIVTGKKYIQIEFASGTKEEMRELIEKQGKFEAKIPKLVKINGDKGSLNLGNKSYEFFIINNSIFIDSKTLEYNKSIEISGIKTEVINITNDSVVFLFTVFSGSDIKSVCLVEQPNICTSRIYQTGKNSWEFMFSVSISDAGAKKFADVTKGMNVYIDPRTGHSYLESKLYLFLDDILLNDLSISGDLAGKIITNPVITGGGITKAEASQEMLKLKSILQSGALPVSVNIVKIDHISASLGSEFIQSSGTAVIIALIMIFIFLSVRYRNLKLSSIMTLWTFFELIIILGAAALIKWTLDLPTIVGIITILGTGIDVQIMIVDEILHGNTSKEVYTIKQRIKKALFMVFGSASTVIAAMIPLAFIGMGVMRGFAIITIIGIIIGLFITRPAFALIAEKILK
ncbi:MAG: MMPL family transporter [Candidatus Aenigmarchaeota archaeon]|nr:MMPL family transporter [Candidatus Aenigmarchaeota archaeon]